ncbi:hypothetical protein L210DRAFT_3658981 [Boletus edulis BED1]|uniref:Uncharacterized protein n=1 Tax=Boletus edulis BED1 TaxID=1328754 RepID=A0AAD4B9R5_BOLED|nr:hypothetical protein L210DRAFT_3658981 [Boletus edulis BED1]
MLSPLTSLAEILLWLSPRARSLLPRSTPSRRPTTLQAGTAGNYVEALSGSDYTWIQNLGKTHVWDVENAREGEKVMFEKKTRDMKVWIFQTA